MVHTEENTDIKRLRNFCVEVYVKKVMKLLAFIFEQPSYFPNTSGDVFFSPLQIKHIKQRYFGVDLHVQYESTYI